MRFRRPNPECWRGALVCGLALLLFGARAQGPADTVVLHLRNGDRLTGLILCEDTNEVVISTMWVRELSVPVDEIVARESGAPLPPAGPPPPPPLEPLPVAVVPLPPKPKHWTG